MKSNECDVKNVLHKHENIIWIGRPEIKSSPRMYFVLRYIFTFVIILVFFPSIILTMVDYEASRKSLLILITVLGLVIVFVNMSPIIASYKKKRVCYVITNNRAIIYNMEEKVINKEIILSNVRYLVLRRLTDGIGDIKFFDRKPIYSSYHSNTLMLDLFQENNSSKLLLLDINDSESVFNKISPYVIGAHIISETKRLL